MLSSTPPSSSSKSWFETNVEDLKKMVVSNTEPEEPKGMWAQMCDACALTWEQRLWGFGFCFCMGMLLSFLSTFFVSGIILGRPQKFALLYSFGQFCSLGSSMFLMGPWEQIKSMFSDDRRLATSVYLISVVLTIVSAIKVHSAILVLICIGIQLCALAWYSISYIPYARELVWGCIKKATGW